MARFESEDDPGFRAVTGELRRWIKHLTVVENPKTLNASITQPSQAKQQQDSSHCT